MASIALQYFEHVAEYSLAICKECRYAVLPNHIPSHLQRLHRCSQKHAESVAQEVSEWAGLVQYASEVEVPNEVTQMIAQLPLYEDGMLCRLADGACSRVYRSVESIRKHWREAHGWSVADRGGRPSRVGRDKIKTRIKEGYITVHCQRLFVQGHGSQYFRVCQPDHETEPVSGDAAWGRMGEAMAEAWANVQARAKTTIQEGTSDEVNPWLERTQWLPYLIGMKMPELLACIEEPVADPDPRKEIKPEPVEAAIWTAMGGLARFSQASVIERIGVFVRLEAIRTEKHQTRFQPLQPYMDEKDMVRHTRPWQQILMFLARTQREHTWKSPKYRFTRRQREAWEALIRVAAGSIEGDEEDEEDEDIVDNMSNYIDEGVEEIEMDEGREEAHIDGISQPKKLSKIQKACLEFCIALLNQSITRKEYDSPLVCALAVLGVKEGGWKGPEQYPPILSAVIKVSRFMVVQQALELSEPSVDSEFDSDSAYDSDESSTPPRPRRKGCLQFVQDMMDKFMVRGSHGPMQWMLDLRTYGLKIHYNTTSQGHVDWVGQDTLLYKDLQFNMAQFRSMVHGLTAECRRLLMDELLFSNSTTAEPVPSIPWDALRDNPANATPGWNFLKDKRTQMPVDGEKWLFERIGKDIRLRDKFIKPGTRSGIDRQEVERYMDRVIEFRTKMAVLELFALGQPIRFPEFGSIRHSNTIKGGHRNTFIEDGMVVFATRYHKGYNISGDIKIIHRYLPREVGELVVWYLWLVLPFQQRLEAMIWNKEAVSSHMLPADPNGRKWTSDRFREALKRESRVSLGQEFTIAGYREIAIAISRRFLRGSTAFKTDEGEENEEWNEENIAALIADEQAGHTAHVAGLIYARGIMEQAGVIAEKRAHFRMCSIDWHRFLGFGSGKDDKDTCKKRKRARYEDEADEARVDRCMRMRKMDTATQLQRMMGETAKFRGIQKEAIEAILAGESPVVAVMPTGAGKSMLFMLPAWAEQGGTTVVVVPLIALRGDIRRRCQNLGISCAEWDIRRPPDAAAVVLVTPESAVKVEFATFLNRMRATRQLDRIVIDECHIVLNRRYTFRKEMQRLGKLVGAETQMVLLTATLPPSEEDNLFQRMHFDRDEVKMFRAATTRTNISYGVFQISKTVRKREVERITLRIIQKKVRRYKTGKIIIYGNSVAKVKRLSQQLGCNAYHHDAAGKASMLEEFMGGKQRIIVATSALGMGVDIADIRCIIHIDWPFSMLDYAQESGRAGRDGLPSEAIVIAHEGEQWKADDKQTQAEQALVRLYIQGTSGTAQCRRVVLDEYLDVRETTRVQCEEEEVKCDICRGNEHNMEEEEEEEEEEDKSETRVADDDEIERQNQRQTFRQQERERQAPRQRLMQERQQEFGEIEWLRRQLALWSNRCGICEAAGDGSKEHDVRHCWRVESRQARKTIEEVETNIQFEPYSGCYWCGVPQEICNRWEPNGQGRYQRSTGGQCQYKGVVVSGLIGILVGFEEIGERWARHTIEEGIEIENIQGLSRYWGSKQQLEIVESNNLVKQFCWVTRLMEI